VSEPIIAVGLGNPGFQYETTRHNVGFMVVDALSTKLKCRWSPGRGEFLFSEATVQDTSLLLVKPLTYMNDSGIAVQDVLERYAVPISRLVVVLDDFWFDVGAVRVRTQGSDGGHNGLASIIYHLNSEEFARVRCGIRSVTMPPKNEMADFVLSPFTVDETEKVGAMISNAADAVMSFVLHGIEKTMNTFNV
jgi:PTH1 family peptidyl-tRNA hydrolase